ncbi:CLUMA_CG019647, isoform A, partial [Clunio marinus]
HKFKELKRRREKNVVSCIQQKKDAFFVSENHQTIDMAGHDDTCVEQKRTEHNTRERNGTLTLTYFKTSSNGRKEHDAQLMSLNSFITFSK